MGAPGPEEGALIFLAKQDKFTPVSANAGHAVMLGGESPLSRCAWSRRTSEAQGRHREVGSEGSVERMCGASATFLAGCHACEPDGAGCEPRSNHVGSGADSVGRRPRRESMIVGSCPILVIQAH